MKIHNTHNKKITKLLWILILVQNAKVNFCNFEGIKALNARAVLHGIENGTATNFTAKVIRDGMGLREDNAMIKQKDIFYPGLNLSFETDEREKHFSDRFSPSKDEFIVGTYELFSPSLKNLLLNGSSNCF